MSVLREERRRPPWALLLACLLLASGLLAPASEARGRRAPPGFYGATWDRGVARSSDGDQDRQWGVMARTGVESARAMFSWATAQPGAGDPFDFERTDRLVALAARHRIRLLPLVEQAPVWARRRPSRFGSPPKRFGDYAAYLTALVRRYGPRGTFWDENPQLRRRPLREWQIWNEPHLQFYWDVGRRSPDRWPMGYVRLLKVSRAAIKSADRRASVVAAGLTNESWRHLGTLYRRHAGRLFDVVAVQTYTSSPLNLLRAYRKVRTVMRRHQDRRKRLWATELGWPASRGRTRARPAERSFVTTDLTMARRLKTIYAYLVKRRRNPRYRVSRAYWYTWASSYRPGDIFDYSGLLRFDGMRFHERPAVRYYRSSAIRYEGCVKTTAGACR